MMAVLAEAVSRLEEGRRLMKYAVEAKQLEEEAMPSTQALGSCSKRSTTPSS